MAREVDKAAIARLLHEHGLATAPFHEVGLADVHRLVDLYSASARLVVRTSTRGTAERNLPRLVDATPQAIVEWSVDLPPGTALLVSPYGHLIASAEVAMTPTWSLVEAVYGIWELDSIQRPGSAMGRRVGDDVTWNRRAMPTASSQRRFSFAAGVDSEGPVPSWLLEAFCDWASDHAPRLDALSSATGTPQIVKVLYYAEWGMQAMNARPIGDLFAPSDDEDPTPPPGTPVVARTDQAIVRTPVVIVSVATAREDAASLDRLITRMVDAGVQVAHIESGLLSHAAIALREAGIRVRRL